MRSNASVPAGFDLNGAIYENNQRAAQLSMQLSKQKGTPLSQAKPKNQKKKSPARLSG